VANKYLHSPDISRTLRSAGKNRLPYEEDSVYTWSPSFEQDGRKARCSNLTLGAIGRLVPT
jgi:hypothetical protein